MVYNKPFAHKRRSSWGRKKRPNTPNILGGHTNVNVHPKCALVIILCIWHRDILR